VLPYAPMETAVGIVDELLESDVANDPVIRKRLVRLRQLLSDGGVPPTVPTTANRTAPAGTEDLVGNVFFPPAEGSRTVAGKGKVTGYRIYINNDDEFLDEERYGHPPFRVHRAVYDAAVRAIDGAKGPIQFKAWLDSVQELRESESEPEYRLRVIVRFWLLKGLLKKEGTRYRPSDRYARHFAAAANRVWTELPHPDRTA
jgi:hypothetical protein